MEQDQQFLEYVVKALADFPDDVKITRTVDEMGVLLLLSVNKDDMGKIIGRSGQTAKAIRTVLRVVGMKNDANNANEMLIYELLTNVFAICRFASYL